jgi:hypothetical protein
MLMGPTANVWACINWHKGHHQTSIGPLDCANISLTTTFNPIALALGNHFFGHHKLKDCDLSYPFYPFKILYNLGSTSYHKK